MTAPRSPEEPRSRAVSALLRLYPAAWRDRYGDELAWLLADQLAGKALTPRAVLDLVRGAIDAHLNLASLNLASLQPENLHLEDLKPENLTLEKLQERWSAMVSRLRSTAVTTFTAWVVFCIAVAGLVKVSEEPAFTRAAQGYAGIGVSYAIVQGAFVLALVAVLVGGLPLAFVALRQAWRDRDTAMGWLVAVPVLAAAAVAAYIVGANRVSDEAAPSVHSGTTIALFVGLVAVGGAATVATVVAIRVAAHRATLPTELLRLAGWCAVVAAGAISLGLLALISYGWALRAEVPTLFHSDNGLLATALPTSLLGIAAMAVIATVLADRAAFRGLRVLRGGPEQQV